MTIRLRLSDEGQMLDSMSLSSLATHKREAIVMPHRDVFGVVSERLFWPCEFDGIQYIADFITGTLYDAATGECCGTKQMAIVSDAPDKPKKLKGAREAAGWNNEARRAVA